MRRRLLDFDWTTVTLVVAWFMFVVAGCPAQLQHRPSATQDSSLKKFLQNYEGSSADEVSETRYSAAFVDLRENGAQQVIVYLTGNWCGTGGCTMLILTPEGTSYRVITKTPITRLPIRVLTTRSNGWHDISVRVQGGGIQPGGETVLPFDGKSYPDNPTMPPARRLAGKAAGRVVLGLNAEETPLYP
jgi:hypothetical protein